MKKYKVVVSPIETELKEGTLTDRGVIRLIKYGINWHDNIKYNNHIANLKTYDCTPGLSEQIYMKEVLEEGKDFWLAPDFNENISPDYRIASLPPKVEEEKGVWEDARSFAENEMAKGFINGWDRNDGINIGTFYKYYIDYIQTNYKLTKIK